MHAQSCLTLCNLMASSPPGSSDHGISQARVLGWIAISYSRASSWPRDQTRISCIGRWILYHGATWEAQPICNTAIKSLIKNLLMPETAGWDGFSGGFFQIFWGKINTYIIQTFPKKRGKTSKLVLWGQHISSTKPDTDITREHDRIISLMYKDAKFLNTVLKSNLMISRKNNISWPSEISEESQVGLTLKNQLL